jgi:hypothetical protein
LKDKLSHSATWKNYSRLDTCFGTCTRLEAERLPDPKLRKRFDLLHTTTADTQGHFKFRGVGPGEYTVFALEGSQSQPFMTDLFFKTE